MGNVIHIETEQEFDEYWSGSNVVVDFGAVAWCGPCRAFAPHYDKAAENFDNVVFLAVDVDKNEWAMQRFGIQSVPTIIGRFNDGKIVDLSDGKIRNAPKFIGAVQSHLDA